MLFERAPRFGLRDLRSYAEEIGLDADQFSRCLEFGQHEATVERDTREAIRIGLRGTPSFIVNDQPLVGPTPERMIQVIEGILASK